MYFAIDIGGSKTRVAGSLDCVNFDEPKIYDTPKTLPENLEEIKKIILGKISGSGDHVQAIAIGIAGTLNESHSVLMRAPHLVGWENFDIKEFFEKDFGQEIIFIENDTELVGLGEYTNGAGQGSKNMVYMTISTGIGGVKIVDGSFEGNKFGFEPGHMIMNAETGETWEDLASGTAVQKKFGMHPREVAKTEYWPMIERYVCEGLHNVILHWSPDLLVVGGSMANDLNADRLRAGITDLMKIHPALPEIKLATLGSLGGVYGGFAFLKKKFNV